MKGSGHKSINQNACSYKHIGCNFSKGKVQRGENEKFLSRVFWSTLDQFSVIFNERKLVLGTAHVKVKVKVKVKVHIKKLRNIGVLP